MIRGTTILTTLTVILVMVVCFVSFELWFFIKSINEGSGHLLFLLSVLIISLIGVIAAIWVKRMQRLRANWARLKHDVNVDPLTGLYNQQKLIADLEKSEHTNLAFLKVTNFNSMLNSYGPAVIDDVLKQIASLLANYDHKLIRKASAYYIQPGVFAILEDQKASIQQIATITEDILKTLMNAKYQVGFEEYIAINITVGAVRHNEDSFVLANMALQEAINKKLQFYLIDKSTSQLPEIYKKELKETQILLQAIHDRRVTAYFQPIVSAEDMTVSKYECLARVVDEQGKVILMPGKFMPLAHRANVYYLLSQIMVKKAADFALENNVVVTVNISITDINNTKTCEYIFEKIKNTGVGHLLQFELLENEVVVDTKMITRFIFKLQSLGCQVGMDDLGKGYSNIERLLSLPINFVKIDRTIMENISQSSELHKLAQGIVKLAKKKKLEVVAEYCSNAEVTDLAIKLGVDYLQGFYFGKPQPNVVQQPLFPQALNG